MILYMKKLTRRNKTKNRKNLRRKTKKNKCGGATNDPITNDPMPPANPALQPQKTYSSSLFDDLYLNPDKQPILDRIFKEDTTIIHSLHQLLVPGFGDIMFYLNTQLPSGVYLNWVDLYGTQLLHVSIHTGIILNRARASPEKIQSYFEKGNMHIKFDFDNSKEIKLIVNEEMGISHELGRALTDSPKDIIIGKIIELLQKYVDENIL
jgi:hypothetical protein